MVEKGEQTSGEFPYYPLFSTNYMIDFGTMGRKEHIIKKH